MHTSNFRLFVLPLQLGNDGCKLIRRLILRLFVVFNRLLGMINKKSDKNTSHYDKKYIPWTRYAVKIIELVFIHFSH